MNTTPKNKSGGQRTANQKSLNRGNDTNSAQNQTDQSDEPAEQTESGMQSAGLVFTLQSEKTKEVYILFSVERRTDYGLLLTFPGGKRDGKEGLWDTACRESDEETYGVLSRDFLKYLGFGQESEVKFTRSPDGESLYAAYLLQAHGDLPDKLTTPTVKAQKLGQFKPLTETVCSFEGSNYCLAQPFFPQYPISLGVSFQDLIPSGLVLPYLPLIYDYVLHKGKIVLPFPSPEVKSVFDPKKKSSIPPITRWNPDKLAIPGWPTKTMLKSDFSQTVPEIDKSFGLHWVSLRELRNLFQPLPENINPLSEIPNQQPIVYYYNPSSNQEVWDIYYNSYFNTALSGDEKIMKNEKNYTRDASAQDQVSWGQNPNQLTHIPKHKKKAVTQNNCGKLFVVKTTTGLQFPLSSLATAFLTQREGILNHFAKTGPSQPIADSEEVVDSVPGNN